MIQTFGPEFASLDAAFLAVMRLLLREGGHSAPRALPTRELAPFSFAIADPRCRYVSVPARRWSIAYAIGEFAWHLRGSDSTEEIAFYAPRWRRIAGGRPTITGSSYGAKVFGRRDGLPSQWDRALALLRRDTASRRAVIYLSSPDADQLDPEADIACALSLQLILREGRLDAVCTMRSNDAVLGLPYDVFLFTMLQEMAAVELGCELGRYYHQAGSMHLYDAQIGLAQRIAESQSHVVDPMAPMSALHHMDVLLDGEASIRLGQCQRPGVAEPSDRYWSNLLEVVEGWGKVHAGEDVQRQQPLRDPILNALFEQWRSMKEDQLSKTGKNPT